MPKDKKKAISKPVSSREPASSDDDDSSIASDEAFDSEDERRYGSFFEKRNKALANDGGMDDESSEDEDPEDAEEDSQDASESDDDEEEEEDGDGGEYMLGLLDKLDYNEQRDRGAQSGPSIAAHTKESEFSASVVKKADLTLESLMGSIQDTIGFGQAQKQLKKVALGSASPVPVARVVSERLQRKHDYTKQCKEVSQWVDAVQQNRQAETLDFRPKQRLEITKEGLVDSFVPTTDFEKQIHAALQKAGQEDEAAILQREDDQLKDDLGANEISLDEYKRRRNDLAKMRALMFYHEQKRHHINKIKSKKYRRIRKRQRERSKGEDLAQAAADDEELAKELEEKEEVERIRERASLTHKNTSKWAKRVLKRGNKVDMNTRKALSEAVRRGDDLLKRMKSTRAGDESDSDEDLVASAKAVLADAKDETSIDGGKRNGLFQLSFMKKGVEKQKALARAEARQLLKELEADENNNSDDDNRVMGDPPVAAKVGMASKAEMETVLRENEIVVSSLKFGIQQQVSVTGNIAVELNDESHLQNVNAEQVSRQHSQHDATIEQPHTTVGHPTTTATTKRPSTRPVKAHTQDDEANPWLAPQVLAKKSGKMSKATRGLIDVDGAVELLGPAAEPKSMVTIEAPSKNDETSNGISSLSQDELVRRAFASSDLEENEFAMEKARLAEEEDPMRKFHKEASLSTAKGWGSWTGAGAPPPKPPRKLPKKLQAPESKLGKRVRLDDKKPGVILSEKRLKKTANNYMLASVPYPFTSREEYEKAMSGSLGNDFNVTAAFKDMTRPAVITRPGKVIQPLSKQVKVRRTAANF
jgi:U3 small nucleolar RNA-associated protein 14